MSAFLASFSRVFATRHAGRGFSHSWGLGRTRELSMSEYAGVLTALGHVFAMAGVVPASSATAGRSVPTAPPARATDRSQSEVRPRVGRVRKAA